MKARYGLLMACSLACTAALAQDMPQTETRSTTTTTSSATSVPATASNADVSLALTPKTENGITYLCGGIGSSEAAQMKRDASSYNLMLTFAENTGAYLADVDVHITDTRGNDILQTTCDAPIMLVNFPKAGTYRVRAEVAGHPLNRVVRVSSRGRHSSVAMVWPRGQVEQGLEGGPQG